MSKKSAKIAALIQGCEDSQYDAHYLGYFHCFNQQLFYEAHDVLEELWLGQRDGPNYAFYKGLIQFAGAFVHLQKNRLMPAASLFRLARSNLAQYPSVHDGLSLRQVLAMIDDWLGRLEAGQFRVNPLTPETFPRLALLNRPLG